MDETGEHHLKQCKPVIKGQRSHVFPPMYNLDIKNKYIHIISYTHTQKKMITLPDLFEVIMRSQKRERNDDWK
jgi:hypothetical protein